MSDSILRSALKLSKPERILLAERLWDSVAEQADAPELTPEQTEELLRRLKQLDENGRQGRPWAQVKRRILRRRK